jgi:hypothetical protein
MSAELCVVRAKAAILLVVGILAPPVAAGSETSSQDLAAEIASGSRFSESVWPFPQRLKASIHLQMRYNFNKRGSDSTTLAAPDDDITIGFTNRRTKLGLSGDVTETISAKVKFGFSQSTGSGALESAELKWKASDSWTLRVGQFKPGLLREENISSSKQLTVDRSAMNETYNQDFTQGIEIAKTEDDWRLSLSFNDGFGSDNTYALSPSESDYGLTARGELKFGHASWSELSQFTSWRGANGGFMIGAGIHYQSMGNTAPSTMPSTDLQTITVDASLIGDGWNIFGAGVWRSMDSGPTTRTDAGFVFQGGVFVSDLDEFFARWDMIMPSSSAPVVVGTSGNKEFQAFTVGWNHYIIPESHAAKFTLELQHYPDPTTESIVKIKGNLLPDSTGDQFAVTAQFQLLF